MPLFVICKNEREPDIIVSNHIMSSIFTVVSKLFDKGLETQGVFVTIFNLLFFVYEKENVENLFGELIFVENCAMIKNKKFSFSNTYKENKRTLL